MKDREDWKDDELVALKDRSLDFSDIPELTPSVQKTLKRVVPREYYKVIPIKKAISIKLDADVLEYFKSKGKGYQTRMNSVLRQEMLRESAPSYGKRSSSSEPEEE
ncbi:MAG: BrnA antitoxin family protein [Sphaerochaeta sp.]